VANKGRATVSRRRPTVPSRRRGPLGGAGGRGRGVHGDGRDDTHLLCLAGGCQWQDVVGMSRVPVSQTKPAGRDLAEGAIEAHGLADVF
jgi:hypothetical protein